MVDEAGTTQQAGTVTRAQAEMLLLLSKSELKRLEREGAFREMAPGFFWLKDLVQGFVRHVGKRDVSTPVSVARMAEHLSCAPAFVRKLCDQAVIERRSDGRFDMHKVRAQYIASLREARKISPRGAADNAFTEAKTALVQLRVAERAGKLIPGELHDERCEQIVGTFLAALSSMPAQCAPVGDLPARRRLEKWVRDVRISIATTMSEMADAEENGTSAVRAVSANERVGL